MKEDDGELIIDPPVSAFSSSSAIRAWLAELEAGRPHRIRRQAIDDARRWLAIARSREAQAGDVGDEQGA